jgi:hypothetical protein
MHGERSEKLCTVLRIESVLNSRNELIEKQNPFLPTGGKYKLLSETLLEAYDNLEEAYADVIIAEAKCLESLKEMAKHTDSKDKDEDLEYLRQLSEKEYLELKEKTTLEMISQEHISKIVTEKLKDNSPLFVKGFDVGEGSTTHDIVMTVVDVMVQVLKETEKRDKAKKLLTKGYSREELEELCKSLNKAPKNWVVEQKEPSVINISLNIDKDIDIETIANELIEKLKNVSI